MSGDTFTGRCACGAVSYSVAGTPIDMNLCQCRQCQLASGAGHSAHIAFHGAAVETSGSASHWASVGEQGTRKRRAFCGSCGSPVYMTFPDMPDLFVISPATLDDLDRFAPQTLLWTAAARPWDQLDPALRRFEKLPPPPASG
jgi:hypothetical protein